MDYNYNYCPSSNFNSSSSSSTASKKAASGGNKKPGKTSSSSTVRLSTDPQSVAARERRHRISDRFKILQSMVPGGTKMDTVSMLDEAIQYVKFLKAQIWLHQSMISFDDNVVEPDATDLHLPAPAPAETSCFPSQYPDKFGATNIYCNGDENLLPPFPPQPQPPLLPMPEYSCFHGPENMSCYDAYAINYN